MRVLVSILFSAVAVFAEDPQAFTPSAQVVDNLSIPAQLSRTVDTNKCKSGDPIEMRTLEPVLISNGLVMPENAKLHGRILGAASRENNQPSWLVLVVERAEWKQHSIPLHAFVATQITVKSQVSRPTGNTFGGAIMSQTDALNARRIEFAQNSGRHLPPGMTHRLQDATVDRNDGEQVGYQGLDDLRLMKASNGTVFLVSPKPHLKLPSGAMFMLRNQATPAAAQATPAAAQATPAAAQAAPTAAATTQ